MPRPLLRLWLCALALGVSPTLAQSALEEMRSSLEGGFYAIAAQVLGPSLVAEFPDDPEAHFLYARALYLTDAPAEARSQLEQALALEPAPPAPYLRLSGLLYAAEGDGERALAELGRAAELSQDHDTALDWGRIAWQLGDYERALAAFDLAAATPEGGREVWAQLNRGRVLMTLERWPEALEAFEAAILIFEANDPGVGLPSPGYVEAFFRLGEIYERQGDLGQARAFYEAARSSDPNYRPAIAALERLP